MKIQFDYEFVELDGSVSRERIIDQDDNGNPKRDAQGFPFLKLGEPLTLKKICTEVLMNPPVEINPQTGREIELTAEVKLKWADLAMRIFKADGAIDVSPEEIVLLKKFINKRHRHPLLVMQAYDVLDNPLPKEPKNMMPSKRQ